MLARCFHVVAATLVCLSAGCATLLNDDTQPVAFDTEPTGATVAVDGVRQGITPCVIPVPRKGFDKMITFEKPGYKTVNFKLKNGLNAAIAGNLIFGGFVGLGIDAISGRGGSYQKSVKVILQSGSGVIGADYGTANPPVSPTKAAPPPSGKATSTAKGQQFESDS